MADSKVENPGESANFSDDRRSLDTDFILEVIQIRLVKWLFLGGLLFILWGQANAWPNELIFSSVLLPLGFLFSQRHYMEHDFALCLPEDVPVWDFLIACVLLTIGIASGKIFLISIGWVSMGIAFLKPTKKDLDWSEWFKIPLLWMFMLPVWLDFKNNAFNLADFLVTNPLARDFDSDITSWDYTRFHFGIVTSIIILAGSLRGSVFWKSIILVPIIALFYSWLDSVIPDIQLLWTPLQTFLSWILIPATIFCVAVILIKLNQNKSLSALSPTTDFIRKKQFSSFTLWLSFVVIVMQQFNLIKDNYFIENTQRVNHLALILWLGGLIWVRYKSPKNNVDTRSKIILALALAMLLTGEWTDINFLRHISLGMGFLTLCSWRRVWPSGLIFTLLFTWILIIPAGQTAATIAISGGFGREVILTLAMLGNLIILSIFGLRHKTDLRILNSGDYEWLPSMRFAFLILILLTCFQLLSSFSSTSEFFTTSLRVFAPKDYSQIHNPPSQLSGLKNFEILDSQKESNQSAYLITGIPNGNPYEVPSALLTLNELGWEATNQKLVHNHPNGVAMSVDIQSTENPEVRGSAIYWWMNGQKAFHSHKKAQTILWSSWYFAERDLVLFILIQEGGSTSSLIKEAQSAHWYPNTAYAIEKDEEKDSS